MHFDDRLATVLRVRVGGELAARTQLRQLLDLLGTMPGEARGEQVDNAWVRLGEVAAEIPASERAAMLAEPGLRLRSPRLIAELACSDAPVAAAALRAAQLTEAQWLDLIPALPVPVRPLVRNRRDLGPRVDTMLTQLGIAPRALPAAGSANVIAANDQSDPIEQPARLAAQEGIGAIVQRIEAYRKRRSATQPAFGDVKAAVPASPPAATIDAIAFATDEAGRIKWANALAAPAVNGLCIAASDEVGPLQASEAVTRAFRRRQPIRASIISIAGAPSVAGDWQVDAVPRFDTYGRFTGYHGHLRRPAPTMATPASDSETDRLRQVLHELRTPVNAIQGFAEVIQQQLFGPTPHEYRAHAAAIAGDAARMLAGFDELERLAKLDSGAIRLEPGQCDLAEIVVRLAGQLDRHLAQRSSGIQLSCEVDALPVCIAAQDAERLIWRVLATLASSASPGERIKGRLRRKHGMAQLTIALPASLALLDDPFQAAATTSPSPISASMFGCGFALRLAETEARGAGGSLIRRDTKLRLQIPEATALLTDPVVDHNQSEGFAG